MSPGVSRLQPAARPAPRFSPVGHRGSRFGGSPHPAGGLSTGGRGFRPQEVPASCVLLAYEKKRPGVGPLFPVHRAILTDGTTLSRRKGGWLKNQGSPISLNIGNESSLLLIT